jgi:hypothetical protein
MKRIVITLLFVAVGSLGASSALAGGKTHPVTFSGSCEFHGSVAFTPPATNTPAQGSGEAHASGPCSGTFTDKRGRTQQLNGATVQYYAQNSGLVSCTEGIATGTGYLVINGNTLSFSANETRATAVAMLDIRGASGGSAKGEANISPDTDPADTAAKCSGSGLESVGLDFHIATTPNLSG